MLSKKAIVTVYEQIGWRSMVEPVILVGGI